MESWWGELENDVLACLQPGNPTSIEAIAQRLSISEGAVTSLVAMLAREGKIRIRVVEPLATIARGPRAA
jgi:DNA-binding Lrp family transcriptional regulator